VKAQVSVIIPTYNYAEYIEHAIDSVLKQTYQNIEIIIVDDGSTDDTQDRLRKYGTSICYIRQSNQGASSARNRGLNEAQGDYISFLDADDAYRVDNVAQKVAFLEAQQQYDWCYSDWAWVDASRAEVMFGHEPEVSLAHKKVEGDVLLLALQGYRLGTNVFMFKRSLINQLGGFDEGLKVLEDYDYYLRAAALSPLGFIDEVLCDIYQHEGSLGTGCKREVAYLNRWFVHRKIKRLFAKQLKQAATKRAWKLQEADLYRNLGSIMLDKGHVHRASACLQTSLKYHLWQPGALNVLLKIIWAKVD